jgi:hypothetical protein
VVVVVVLGTMREAPRSIWLSSRLESDYFRIYVSDKRFGRRRE